MAKSGKPARRPGRPQSARPARPGAAAAKRKQTPKKTPAVVFDRKETAPDEPRTFRLGAVPGATPGRWIDTWKQRMPRVTLELSTLTVSDQESALREGLLDAAIIRLPINRDGLHVISLYDEVPVVVAAVDSHLMATDELDVSDLAGEVVLHSNEDVLGPLDLPGTVAASIAPLLTTSDAIEAVAAGVGIAVVPMSLARLHHRKDVDFRPLRAGTESTVALAWPVDGTSADVDAFIGIVRGRTANSSR